jgi:hypothetical protein
VLPELDIRSHPKKELEGQRLRDSYHLEPMVLV